MLFIQNILAITTIVVLGNDREDFVCGCLIGLLEFHRIEQTGIVMTLTSRKIVAAIHNPSQSLRHLFTLLPYIVINDPIERRNTG